jgi:hypothetical protein
LTSSIAVVVTVWERSTAVLWSRIGLWGQEKEQEPGDCLPVVKSHITDLAKQVAGLTKTSTFGLSDSDVISFFSSSQNVTPGQ